MYFLLFTLNHDYSYLDFFCTQNKKHWQFPSLKSLSWHTKNRIFVPEYLFHPPKIRIIAHKLACYRSSDIKKVFWPKILNKEFSIGNCLRQICPLTMISYLFDSNLDTVTAGNTSLPCFLYKQVNRKINNIANARLLPNEENSSCLKANYSHAHWQFIIIFR